MDKLSKAEKKLCRDLLEKGIQKEFEASIREIDDIINKWKNKEMENRETYVSIYHKVKDNQKEISSRYDYIKGSHYFSRVTDLYALGLISEEDIGGFSDANRAELNRVLKFRRSSIEDNS